MKNYSGKDLWNNKVGGKVGERERGRRETVKNHCKGGSDEKCETEVMHGWEER